MENKKNGCWSTLTSKVLYALTFVLVIYAIPAVYHLHLVQRVNQEDANLKVLALRLQTISESYKATKDMVVSGASGLQGNNENHDAKNGFVVLKDALICLSCSKAIIASETLDTEIMIKNLTGTFEKVTPLIKKLNDAQAERDSISVQYSKAADKSAERALLKEKIFALDSEMTKMSESITSKIDAVLESYSPLIFNFPEEKGVEEVDETCILTHAHDAEKKASNFIEILQNVSLGQELENGLNQMKYLKNRFRLTQMAINLSEIKSNERSAELGRYEAGMTAFQSFFSRHLPNWAFLKYIFPFPY